MIAPRVSTLFKPRSVAVVGASARGGPGSKLLQTLRASKFSGPIWPISRSSQELDGLRCLPALDDLPEIPDCLLVAVPADAVIDVLENGAKLGIPSAVVVSEGFADAGTEQGRERQERLAYLAKRAGMAIAGPNSIGIASLNHSLVATITDVVPESAVPGSISLVSQSGGLMLAAAELCANRGIGLDKLVSIGNQAVLDFADYIESLSADPQTRVIALIIEGVGNGRRFRAALEGACRSKPVVVLKLGRSENGQAATLAHTGTLAGRDEAFVALFRQTGVALVQTIDDLVETCTLLDRAPLPPGDRVCMLTISGGGTSLIGDIGVISGINLPPLAEATNQALKGIFGIDRRFGNPVDTVGLPRLLKDDNLARAIALLIADDRIDVIGLVMPMRLNGSAAQDHLIDGLDAAARGARKPVIAISFMSNSLNARWSEVTRRRGVPLLEDVGAAMRAIKSLVDYGTFRRRTATSGAPDTLQSTLPPLAPGNTLTEAESKKMLAAAGFPVTREFLAGTAGEAAQLAEEFDGCVAVKIQSPDIIHKSDIGGVVVGVRGAAAVRAAADHVLGNAARACPEARIDGVLVQEMVDDGIELILGMTYDEQFGPLILLGAGGVNVEVFHDSAVRLAPLQRADVLQMLAELKVAKLLAGFRGAEPCDVDALVDCCLAFSRFVVATEGMIAAVDINPILVRRRGRGVKLVDASIVTNGASAAPELSHRQPLRSM